MKINKLIKSKINQYKIILSDNTSLSFYDDLIVKHCLVQGKTISKEEITKLNLENLIYDAYYEGIRLIKIRLRSKKELSNLLLKKGFSNDNVNNAIELLLKQGYLNDEMYAKCFIDDAINLKIIGPLNIKKELLKLGIQEEFIDEYLNEYIDIWPDKINNYVKRKIKSNHNYSSDVLKKKIIDELLKKGFNYEDLKNNVTINLNDEIILEKEFNKLFIRLSKKYNGEELKYHIKNKLYQKRFSCENIDMVMSKYFK